MAAYMSHFTCFFIKPRQVCASAHMHTQTHPYLQKRLKDEVVGAKKYVNLLRLSISQHLAKFSMSNKNSSRVNCAFSFLCYLSFLLTSQKKKKNPHKILTVLLPTLSKLQSIPLITIITILEGYSTHVIEFRKLQTLDLFAYCHQSFKGHLHWRLSCIQGHLENPPISTWLVSLLLMIISSWQFHFHFHYMQLFVKQ